MNKRLLLIGLVLAAVTVSVTAYYRSNHVDKAPSLITARISRGDVVETVEATGTLEALTTVQVGTQVSGTIKTLHADFNSKVRKGQVVAELDPSLFETQVEQARATLVRLQADSDRARVQFEDARVKVNRARELSARELIPATDLETAEVNVRAAEAAVKSAEAQLVQARASLNQAQVNLNHTVIRSPIDGIVVSRNVDAGQTVAASMQAPTLFVLARDLTQMQVNASIDEADIGRIQPGQRVTFHVDAYADETFAGSVSQVRLQPVVQQNVVSYTTMIAVLNPELKLKPGMTATVTVEIARAENVVRVPNAALRFRPSEEVFAALGQERPRPSPAVQASGGSPEGEGRSTGVTGERFEQMRQRFQQMSPADHERMRATMGGRERGPIPGGGGRVWIVRDDRLQLVRVRAGISDGVNTAIIGDDLDAGANVVTGVATEAAAAPAASSSPLFPMRPGGGRGRPGAPR